MKEKERKDRKKQGKKGKKEREIKRNIEKYREI